MTKLSGTLTDGASNALSLCTIEFIASNNSLNVITQSNAKTVTNESGYYSIELLPCNYIVYITKATRYRIGSINIFQDSADGTLNEYLISPSDSELTPSVISTLKTIRNEVEQFYKDTKSYSDSALTYKNNASQSEVNASKSADNASTSEQNAYNSASSASNSSNSASKSAESAKSDAKEAKEAKDAIINLNPVLTVNNESPDDKGNVTVQAVINGVKITGNSGTTNDSDLIVKTSGLSSIAIGAGVDIKGNNNTAIGGNNTIENADSTTLIGFQNKSVSSGGCFGMGLYNEFYNTASATAIGVGSKSIRSSGSLTIGADAVAEDSSNSIVFGYLANAKNANDAIVLGKGAKVSKEHCVAIGTESIVKDSVSGRVVSIGDADNPAKNYRITNLADGIDNQDAVTLSQVKALIAEALASK